jgi:hypothetical protein
VTFDLFGLQIPQNILLSETSTERNPGPGRNVVAVTTGVMVFSPEKMEIGANVAVGKFGSWVGKWTMVGEGVMVGVIVAVGVTLGVNVTVAVSVGKGVFVGRDKGMPEHACKKITSTIVM